MKNVLLLSLLFVVFCAFTTGGSYVYNHVSQDSFTKGERLKYKVRFGIFPIGEAEMVIQDDFYKIHDRNCYKLDVYGKTTGMVDWVAKVDDHWGSYIDTEALLPHISYRNIKEGNYRKNEVVNFDHDAQLIEAKVRDKKTGEFKEPKYYTPPENINDIRDMLAGYLYLRTIDYSNMKKGDIFTIKGFFEDTFYQMNVKYRGREKVKTKAGKFKAIKLAPIMPDNDLFDGEDSILLWISDDKNKIPLKIEAEMFIGSTGVELVGYQHLRNEVSLIK